MRSPCPPPRLLPELGRALARLRRGRRAHSIAVAVFLGLLTMPERAPRPPLAEAEVSEEFAADAVAAPLPKVFPEGWQRAPCPRDANVRTVKGRCFIATGAHPPCAYGYDDTENGECLVALNAPRREPTSIQR